MASSKNEHEKRIYQESGDWNQLSPQERSVVSCRVSARRATGIFRANERIGLRYWSYARGDALAKGFANEKERGCV